MNKNPSNSYYVAVVEGAPSLGSQEFQVRKVRPLQPFFKSLGKKYVVPSSMRHKYSPALKQKGNQNHFRKDVRENRNDILHRIETRLRLKPWSRQGEVQHPKPVAQTDVPTRFRKETLNRRRLTLHCCTTAFSLCEREKPGKKRTLK